jgi:Asp-tRNA(Asn)/Glu-tRNA(Gln) amidotransferase B subunit
MTLTEIDSNVSMLRSEVRRLAVLKARGYNPVESIASLKQSLNYWERRLEQAIYEQSEKDAEWLEVIQYGINDQF